MQGLASEDWSENPFFEKGTTFCSWVPHPSRAFVFAARVGNLELNNRLVL
jgi:hypothetical protein